MILGSVPSVLSIILIINLYGCDYAVWTIDHNKGELVSSKDNDKPISCFSEAAKDYTCVDSKTLAKLKNKCKRNSNK